MTDTTVQQEVWPDKQLTDAQRAQRQSAELIPFGEHGMTPQNFAQVVDFAKHMAEARGILGNHFIKNYAGCLAIIELAQQFRMRPFMLARQTYFVNNMIAFDGQAIMSIMNLHMPLAKDEQGNRTRLRYEFFGEKAVYEPQEIEELDRNDMPTGKKVWVSKLIKPSTRWVRVTGRMENEANDLVYESPPVFQIKNKKSPLWEEDEDQQLIYWASRRWQRRHWPEGMLGMIDREEAAMMHLGADNAKLITLEDRGQQLIERIQNAKAQTDDADAITRVTEGFNQDHADIETGNGKPTGTGYDATHGHGSGGNGLTEKPKADDGPAPANVQDAHVNAPVAEKAADFPGDTPAEPEHEVLPKDGAQYVAWANAWIAAFKDMKDTKATKDAMNKRWKEETSLRNICGVSTEQRDKVYDYFLDTRDNHLKKGRTT